MIRILVPGVILLTWAAGMAVSFHPIILSGFDRMQADPMDTRLVNYILEHGYRWLTGDPSHATFWSPPVFHPTENAAAYGEVLVSVGPFYWLWRGLGMLPDTSFQLWLITLSTLNFVAALVALRRGLSISWIAASLGAALFAFGSPRLQQLNHAQLLAGFYTVLVLFALLRLFSTGAENSPTNRPGPSRYCVLLVAALTAQLYAGVYVGWFLVLGLGVGLLGSLARPGARQRLAAVLRERKVPLLVSVGVAVALVIPMASRYLAAAGEVGERSLDDVVPMLPRLQSWLFMGPDSWLYGWLASLDIFARLPMEHEHRLGLGLITPAVAIAGLVAHRRHPAVRYAAGTILVICLVATIFPGELTAWRYVFAVVPGAPAIRAVSRAGLFTLIPLAIGLALLADRWLRAKGPRQKRLLVPVLFAVVFLEQATDFPSYDKDRLRTDVATLISNIPDDCEAFLYTPRRGKWIWIKYHVDALWASMESGKPTLNGYSGNQPPGWEFFEISIGKDEDGIRLRKALVSWTKKNSIDPRSIAWIQENCDTEPTE